MISRFIATLIVCVLALPAFAAGDAAAGRSKSQVCAGCHGADGNATIPNYPKLAGQHAGYLVMQMQAFKSDKRKDAIMKGQVANLNEQDMQDLAAYFASQKTTIGAATDQAKRELGERLYRGGNESIGMAACMACHGPNGAGNPPANFPALSGQNSAYTAKSLMDYRAGKTRAFDDKDDAGKIMYNIARRMSNDEIEAVAHYISGLN